ncbi:MAG: AlpA family phage regulatory protein [Pseudomonadota bacterium]
MSGKISQQRACFWQPELSHTGLSRFTIYAWMTRAEFPQPVKLGARLVAWREADVLAWLDGQQTRDN